MMFPTISTTMLPWYWIQITEKTEHNTNSKKVFRWVPMPLHFTTHTKSVKKNTGSIPCSPLRKIKRIPCARIILLYYHHRKDYNWNRYQGDRYPYRQYYPQYSISCVHTLLLFMPIPAFHCLFPFFTQFPQAPGTLIPFFTFLFMSSPHL